MKKKEKKEQMIFLLRVPKSLWKKFRLYAEENRRSANSELLSMIEQKIGR